MKLKLNFFTLTDACLVVFLLSLPQGLSAGNPNIPPTPPNPNVSKINTLNTSTKLQNSLKNEPTSSPSLVSHSSAPQIKNTTKPKGDSRPLPKSHFSCTSSDEETEFNVTEAEPKKLSFRWLVSNCTTKLKNISRYEILINNEYRFDYVKGVENATIENQANTSHLGKRFTIIPCTEYHASLKVIFVDQGEITFSRNFTVPLDNRNPMDSNGKLQVKTGSRWISLTWSMGKACNKPDYVGLRVKSVKVDVNEKRRPPRSMEIQVACADWSANESSVTLNLSQIVEKCNNGSNWTPCTNYSLSLTPVLDDPLNNTITLAPSVNTSARTPIGNAKQDVKIEDLKVAGKGSTWFLLRWRAPYCLPDVDDAYHISFRKDRILPFGWESCPKPISTIVTYDRDHYHSLNSSHCITMEPCTSYQVWIRNEYNSGSAADKETTLTEKTLPLPLEGFKVDVQTPDDMKLTWQKAQDCSGNPPSAYNLVIYVENESTSRFNHRIKGSCTEFHLAQQDAECGAKYSFLPCTKYTFALSPVYKNYSGNVTPVTASQLTPFHDKKESYAINLAAYGTDWAVLNLTSLHPQCFPYVRSVNGTLYENRKKPPTQLTVNAMCLNTSAGFVLLNSSNSSCFPSFPGFQSCRGVYNLTLQLNWDPLFAGNGSSSSIAIQTEMTINPARPGKVCSLSVSPVTNTSLSVTWENTTTNIHCWLEYEITLANETGHELEKKRVSRKSNSYEFARLVPCTSYEIAVYSVGRGPQPSDGLSAVVHTRFKLEKDVNCSHSNTIGAKSSELPIHDIAIISTLGSMLGAVLIILSYFCYAKRYWRKGEAILRQDPTRWSDRVTIGSERKTRFSRRLSRIFMHNYASNRPIQILHFDNVLQELMANTCILLSEEYDDVRTLSNDLQPKTTASKSANRHKNRYLNILPYDHSLVRLNPTDGGFSDYINASYIRGFHGAKEYIAAQGPNIASLHDFWRMIWEKHVSVIVMLTQLYERGKNKCEQYWPDEKQTHPYGNINVRLNLEVSMDDFVIRELELQNGTSTRVVKQLHLLAWPDFGCPDNPDTLLSFIEAVRDRVSSATGRGPILVHCSAGVGRTGTFIAVDWLMQEAMVNFHIDVFHTVLMLRSDRMNMVQTEDQYLFVYRCLAYFIQTRLAPGKPSEENAEFLNLRKCDAQNVADSSQVKHESKLNLAETVL